MCSRWIARQEAAETLQCLWILGTVTVLNYLDSPELDNTRIIKYRQWNSEGLLPECLFDVFELCMKCVKKNVNSNEQRHVLVCNCFNDVCDVQGECVTMLYLLNC